MRADPVHSRPGTGRAGFTVSEVLMATFILVLGMAGVMGLISRLSRVTYASAHTTGAVTLGQDKMEELLGGNYAALAGGSDQVCLFSRAWTVSAATNRVKALTVTVGWADPAGRTSVITLQSCALDRSMSAEGLTFGY